MQLGLVLQMTKQVNNRSCMKKLSWIVWKWIKIMKQ